MSEQQSGAGYPQQPTSGQPQQQAYPQAPYASPQAQYQAQQQYAAYAPPAPSLFDKLGVPSMPAILGLSGLGTLVLAGLIAGTSSGGSGSDEFSSLDGTTLSTFVSSEISGGVLSILVAVIVTFALTLFTGEKLRTLWKALTIAGASLFLAKLLFTMLALGEGDSASDASAWIGALLLVAAYGLFAAGAVMVPGSAAPAAAPAAPQAYPTGQQPAVQPQAPQAPPATQQNPWPQAPQQ
ncbi:hypothetical protein [Glycomyces rhizosphaerae]|uniref:Uncharacterized protein n=1 Tax=Glycomyces rhizosphaerae TaxID=2054422 RepID=A0ABV7PXP9_9ACTN